MARDSPPAFELTAPVAAKAPPRGPHWIHEIEHDGRRAAAVIAGGTVRLLTRGHRDVTRRFHVIATELLALKDRDAVIDGEIATLEPVRAVARRSRCMEMARILGSAATTMLDTSASRADDGGGPFPCNPPGRPDFGPPVRREGSLIPPASASPPLLPDRTQNPGGAAPWDCPDRLLDEAGIAKSDALRRSIEASTCERLVYFAFDLLFLDGMDLRAQPLLARKDRLRELLRPLAGTRILYGEYVQGDPGPIYDRLRETGADAIVSKAATAPYRGGRDPSWVKVKLRAWQARGTNAGKRWN